jgi:uncharacterized protein YjbI with pentapeptide repeats
MMIWLNLLGIMAIAGGVLLKYVGLVVAGCAISIVISTPAIYRSIHNQLPQSISRSQKSLLISLIAIVAAVIVILKLWGFFGYLGNLPPRNDWQAIGSLGLWSGAIGQMMIATIAAYVSWRQYVVSRDLTIEQNRLNRLQNALTQQQTIDNYFQGIASLVLDDNGFLEDWPQERAFAIGRTAALLGSINAMGKARVLRFLSRSKLLTPLQRDQRLGRVILNGTGGYDEDRITGVRVINLGVMLAGTDLSQNDLRWTDLSDASLIRSNLSQSNLANANLARSILYQTNLINTEIKNTRFFYGEIKTASPRAPDRSPNYITGEFSGAVVEDADFSNIRQMSELQREYLCAWCGDKSRATIPGGCQGVRNRLNSIEHVSSARFFDD